MLFDFGLDPGTWLLGGALGALALRVRSVGLDKPAKAEEAERCQLASLKQLLDAIPNPICFKDKEGLYLDCNAAFAALFGELKERLVGKTGFDLFSPDLAATEKERESKLLSKGGLDCREMGLLLPDGTFHTMLVEEATFEGPDGKSAGLVQVLTDISPLKRTEEALRENENKFRTLFETASDAILLFELDGRGHPGLIVEANESATRLTGLSKSELLARTLLDLAPDAARRQLDDEGVNIQTYGRSAFETLFVAKGNREVPVEVSAQLFAFRGRNHVLAIARDITQRRRAVALLQASEEKYRALFEASMDLVFTCLPDGSLLDLNPAGIELLGYEVSELHRLSIIHDLPVNPEAGEEFWAELTETGDVRNFELDLKRKKGSVITGLLSARGVYNARGELGAYYGILRDITEHKQVEQQLLLRQKMESIGRLTSGLAHDFNNRFGAVLGYAAMMKEQLEEGHPFHKYLDNMETAATQAAELTRQLQAFSRRGKPETSQVDLGEIVWRAVQLAQPSFDKVIQVRTNLSTDLPCVEADADKLQEALLSLLVFGHDALGRDGVIELTTGFDEIKENQSNLLSPGNYVTLSLRVKGLRLPAEELERLFEPFWRLSSGKLESAGLALSSAYQVLRSHGGLLAALPAGARDTEFKLWLPEGEQPAVASQDSLPEGAPRGLGELVLLVEDDEVSLSLARDVLEDAGYQVLTARDGEDALQLYQACPDEIALVLLDLILPRLSGRDTYAALRKIKPDVKVLLITGYGRYGLAMEIKDSGAKGLVSKPYRPRQLLQAVHKALEG